MIGTLLDGRYRLDALLGKGGMAQVYRAHDVTLGRDVALKLLGDAWPEGEQRERWLREARAAAALDHPHLVSVYDAREGDGAPYLVMELVSGGTLRSAGPLTLQQVIDVARQLCAALEHAHRNGIVHRDIKPENVLLGRDGEGLDAKLADLGVAWQKRDTRITQKGIQVGTAAYIAPEQALGRDVDGRADLYSLGAMLYECTTGRLPFEGDDALAVVSQHIHAPVVPPRTFRDDMPPALEAIILRCLAKQPQDRFASAAELDVALGAVELRTSTQAAAASATEVPSSDRLVLLEQLGRGRLVGRQPEFTQLRELWVRSQQGQGHFTLISGEPGIGKTRLARELMVLAQLSGAMVLQGGSYEFEATTPYLPFIEALRRWVDAEPADSLRERLGASASVLARLAPGIEAKLGALPALPTLGAQEERLRLFDSVANLLQSLARERGVMLMLDDLHWADHGTISLLHYLVRNLRSERMLLLGAYREIELDRSHPLAAALVDWERERQAIRVQLGRLGLADTSRLLATLFGQEDVSPDFAQAIHRETEGNPFFVEEVVKSLIDQGQIYREGGAWQRHKVDELAIPQSVKAAIGRRLSRLSAPTVEVLHTAAALGKVFEFEELAAAAGAPEERLLDALDEASSAQLLRVERGDAFVFTHDKIREVLHDELNPIRRRRLHQRIGESLETLHARSLDEHIQDLAYHFAESADYRKGLTYSLGAGQQAERVHAHEEALAFLERARECADALEDRPALAQVEEQIGVVHSNRGDYLPAVEHLERALSLTSDAPHRAAIRATIGETLAQIGDARGPAYLEQAVRELDPDTQRLDLARATASLGRYFHYRGRPQEAIDYLERSRVLAEPTDDAPTLGRIYSYLAGAYQHLDQLEDSCAWAERSIELGNRKNAPDAAASGHEFMAENLTRRGLWREALEHGSQDYELGRRAGLLDRMAWSRFVRCWAFHVGGQLIESSETGREGLALAERIGEFRLAIWVRSQGSVVECDRGEFALARTLAERAVVDGQKIDQIVMRAMSVRSLAHWLNAHHQHAEALAPIEEVVRQGEGSGNRIYQTFIHADWIVALLGLGRLDEAARVIRESLAGSRVARTPYAEAIGLRFEGELLARRSDGVGARRSFDQAIEIHERLDTRLELARTLRARGRLRAADDAAGATGDLERARTLFEACGALPEAHQASELIRAASS